MTMALSSPEMVNTTQGPYISTSIPKVADTPLEGTTDTDEPEQPTYGPFGPQKVNNQAEQREDLIEQAFDSLFLLYDDVREGKISPPRCGIDDDTEGRSGCMNTLQTVEIKLDHALERVTEEVCRNPCVAECSRMQPPMDLMLHFEKKEPLATVEEEKQELVDAETKAAVSSQKENAIEIPQSQQPPQPQQSRQEQKPPQQQKPALKKTMEQEPFVKKTTEQKPAVKKTMEHEPAAKKTIEAIKDNSVKFLDTEETKSISPECSHSIGTILDTMREFVPESTMNQLMENSVFQDFVEMAEAPEKYEQRQLEAAKACEYYKESGDEDPIIEAIDQLILFFDDLKEDMIQRRNQMMVAAEAAAEAAKETAEAAAKAAKEAAKAAVEKTKVAAEATADTTKEATEASSEPSKEVAEVVKKDLEFKMQSEGSARPAVDTKTACNDKSDSTTASESEETLKTTNAASAPKLTIRPPSTQLEQEILMDAMISAASALSEGASKEDLEKYTREELHKRALDRIMSERDEFINTGYADYKSEQTILEELMRDADQAIMDVRSKSMDGEDKKNYKSEQTILEELMRDADQAIMEVRSKSMDGEDKEEPYSPPNKCPTDDLIVLETSFTLTPIPEADDETGADTPAVSEKAEEKAVAEGNLPQVPIMPSLPEESEPIPALSATEQASKEEQGPVEEPKLEMEVETDLIVRTIDEMFLCYDDIKEQRGCGCIGMDAVPSDLLDEEDDGVIENSAKDDQVVAEEEEAKIGPRLENPAVFERSLLDNDSEEPEPVQESAEVPTGEKKGVVEVPAPLPTETKEDTVEEAAHAPAVESSASATSAGAEAGAKAGGSHPEARATETPSVIEDLSDKCCGVMNPIFPTPSSGDAKEVTQLETKEATPSLQQEVSNPPPAEQTKESIVAPSTVEPAEAKEELARAAATPAKEDPVVELIDNFILAFDDLREQKEMLGDLSNRLNNVKDCIMDKGCPTNESSPGEAKRVKDEDISKLVDAAFKQNDQMRQAMAKVAQQSATAQEQPEPQSSESQPQKRQTGDVQFELPESFKPNEGQDPFIAWGADDSELMASINADRKMSEMEHENIFRDVYKGVEQSSSGIITRADNQEVFTIYKAPAFTEGNSSNELPDDKLEEPIQAALKVLCAPSGSISYGNSGSSEGWTLSAQRHHAVLASASSDGSATKTGPSSAKVKAIGSKFQGWSVSKKREELLKTQPANPLANPYSI
jgi:hypothetical protein